MFNKMKIFNTLLLSFIFMANAFAAVEIENMRGEVQVRRGMDEHWSDAHTGMLLEDIDTIQTWEGTVVLKRQDGSLFTMGSLSILDISDLRAISRQDMFVFLMSQKVQRMKPRQQPSKLNMPNVTSVHGDKKSSQERAKKESDVLGWQRELNAAKAMYDQEFYTNSVVKLHKALRRHPSANDCGEINLYLGKSFEELDESGQAIDNYQVAVEKAQSCNADIAEDAQNAVRRLSK
jgi:hypothetical protein